jgi:hypothetical protein
MKWKDEEIVLLTKELNSAGFNPGLVGYTYLIYFPDIEVYKYGITNNLKQRMNAFGHKPEIILIREFDLGSMAAELEKQWSNNLEHLKVNTSLLRSGNTETFKL